VTFELRFGFDAIFCAIGFSGAVAPDATTVGLPAADFVGLALATGLTAVDFVGLPVVRIAVDLTGLPALGGFESLTLVVGFGPPTGLPTVVGFTTFVGFGGFDDGL
jgi:hypothetical protein